MIQTPTTNTGQPAQIPQQGVPIGEGGSAPGTGPESSTWWLNGISNQYVAGYPPSGWVQGANGAWYPPSVAAPAGVSNSGGGSTVPSTAPAPANVPPMLVPASLDFTVVIDVNQNPSPNQLIFDTVFNVYPPAPTYTTYTASIPTQVNIIPIPLPMQAVMESLVQQITSGSIQNFFDNTRQLKTLLNFGNDFQQLITNWKLDPTDPQGNTIDVKLYEPLPGTVDVKTQLWITQELSPPVVDRFDFVFNPLPPALVYLRPPNTSVKVTGQQGSSITNATLQSLLTTSSFQPVAPTNPVVEQYYTYDVNQAELNIEYNDYRNFVFYGSAQARLNAFINKLYLLFNIDSLIQQNSQSLVAIGGTGSITGSLAYTALQDYGAQRLDILRSLDAYERFLYYDSGSAYSSSLGIPNDPQDQIYYLSDCTYPKLSGSVVPPSSASGWYQSQSVIATAYDIQNPYSLVNNLPQFIVADSGSVDYVTFFNMVGHQFDILKPYIDQMTYIYSRDSDPTVGLSPDMVWDVAKAFGIELPNQYSVSQLLAYTVGSGSVSGSAQNPKLYSELAAQTWKRFLHNQIHLMKAKGTKDALKTLLNVYGVIPSAVKIRESATPGIAQPTGTYETFQQHTNVLANLSGSYIQVPFATGGIFNGVTSSLVNSAIELRFASPNSAQTQSLINTKGNAWGVAIIPITGTYGTVVAYSASVPVVSSSGLNLYSGNYYHLMLRGDTGGATLEVKRYYNGNIAESSVTHETGSALSASLNATSYVFLGGSGSFYGQPFTGYLDEYRQWGELTSDATFNLHVRYPGMYQGNTSGSALTSLFMRLSFNKPQNLGTTSSLPNESPFVRTSACPPIFASASAIGFPSSPTYPYNFTTVTRTVQRYTPTAGAQWSSNRVIVAPTPTVANPSGSPAPVLYLNNSAVAGLVDKAEQTVSNNLIGFYFSIAEAIDDSIIRSMGTLDLNNLLGDPADLYNTSYASLNSIRQFYQSNYSPNFNINQYVNFVSNLLNPVFTQAKTLVPARTQLLTGVVHEPTILDRSKIDPKIITFGAGVYGPDYKDTPNLSASVGFVTPSASAVYNTVDADINFTSSYYSIAASNETYFATLPISSTLDISAVNSTLSGTIVAPSGGTIYNISAQPAFYSASVHAVSGTLYKLSAQPQWFSPETTYQNYGLGILQQEFGVTSTAQLTPTQLAEYIQILGAYQNTNVISIPTYMLSAKISVNGTFISQSNISSNPSNSISNYIQPEIEMYCNFDTYEATTYFWRVDGLKAVVTTSYYPYNQSINPRGIWTYGGSYNRNDWVVFSGSYTALSGTLGANYISSSWVCITPNLLSGTFYSIIPPYADQQNWQPLKLIPSSTLSPMQAILITGSIYGYNVSLAPSGSNMPLAQGYLPQHWHFNHNKATGWVNARHNGCLQTSASTTDGMNPVTVGFSEGDQLIVNTPQGPVQPVQGPSGLILKVT